MIVKEVLVYHSTEESYKKLDDYIYSKTGKKNNLRPLEFGGKGSVIDLDLNILAGLTVITGIYFPGKRFKKVDEFIKWHSRICKMQYPEAVDSVKDSNDLVALFYDYETDRISYICFRMFDKDSIERYLIKQNDKAISFDTSYGEYWILNSKVNGNIILLRKANSENNTFTDINPDDIDYGFFRLYICM